LTPFGIPVLPLVKESVPGLSGPRTTPVDSLALWRTEERISSDEGVVEDPRISPEGRMLRAGMSRRRGFSREVATKSWTVWWMVPAEERTMRARGLATER
jgi:hypothetical protein